MKKFIAGVLLFLCLPAFGSYIYVGDGAGLTSPGTTVGDSIALWDGTTGTGLKNLGSEFFLPFAGSTKYRFFNEGIEPKSLRLSGNDTNGFNFTLHKDTGVATSKSLRFQIYGIGDGSAILSDHRLDMGWAGSRYIMYSTYTTGSGTPPDFEFGAGSTRITCDANPNVCYPTTDDSVVLGDLTHRFKEMFFSGQIHGVVDPTLDQDAATKKYVDDKVEFHVYVDKMYGVLSTMDGDGGLVDNDYNTLNVSQAYLWKTNFNNLLTKLDADGGTSFSDYNSTLAITDPYDLKDNYNALLVKIDNDGGIVTNTFAATYSL